MWTIRCYDPSSSGTGGIHSWYNLLPGNVKAAVDAALELVAAEQGSLQDLPYYKELRGHCQDLDEVIVNLADGRLFRILTFRGPRRRDCTLLFGFEKTSNADYRQACDSARWRKQGVERDAKRAPECQFP